MPLDVGTPERWRRVKAVVSEALDAPPQERPALLDLRCAGDAALRRDVELLLASAAGSEGFLESSRAAERRLTPSAANHASREPALRAAVEAALAGRYVIERELGHGGMATVYLAEDPHHARRVAIKVLDPIVGALIGSERFLAEVQVTAKLTHPNILPLFDSGEVDGLLYYTMPYVTGETLRERLRHERQLPVADAVRLATAIAGALDYAHRHGVVHRDLKPENILLEDGEPLVADFGIALAMSKSGGARLTETGLTLGTPAYMSPEQAAVDREIDGRSDIYALGAVLYEMLVGEPPFTGTTARSIVARAQTERARHVREQRETVPWHVDRAIDRALSKLPADRHGTARQFAEALNDAASGERVIDGSVIAHAGRARWRVPVVAGAAALAGVAALGGWMLGRGNPRQGERVVRYTLTLPTSWRTGSTYGSAASISPDGRMIAYIGPRVGEGELWLRRLDEDQAHPVAGSADAFTPRFSPDGRWVLWFNSSRLLWLMAPVDGGPATALEQTRMFLSLAGYGGDSVALGWVAGAGHLYAASLAGGRPARFLRDDSTAESAAQWDPVMAPDRGTLFFVSRRRDAAGDHDELAYTTLDDRRVHPIPVRAAAVLGYAAGTIVYVQDDGSIMALPFDLSRHRIAGAPLATGEVARLDAYGAIASLSAHGDLIFSSDETKTRAVLVGGGAPPTAVVTSAQEISFPRYSPDGRRIALSLFTGTRTDVWIYTLASGSMDRLTTDGTDNERAEWSPDGRWVLYRSNRSGRRAIWRQLADGSGTAEQISPHSTLSANEGLLSPDGRTLLYRVDDTTRARDLYTVSLQGPDRRPRPLVATEFDEFSPRFSPDGQWIAYVSNESGHDEVYVRRFGAPGGRTLVSQGGGEEPLWSRDGRRIFYRGPDAIVAASVRLNGEPAVTVRDTVARGESFSGRLHPMYDVAPDGKRVLVLQGPSSERHYTVVLNWARALEQQLAARR